MDPLAIESRVPEPAPARQIEEEHVSGHGYVGLGSVHELDRDLALQLQTKLDLNTNSGQTSPNLDLI